MTTPHIAGGHRRSETFRVMRHRDFRRFLVAAAVSNGGNWMQLIAVQALLFSLTASGAWLGLFTVVTLVPAMLLTPYAGVLADRVSRQHLLRVTQAVQMAASFALWGMYISGTITPGVILVIGLLNGAATGFQTAAWQSFIPLLVPAEHLVDAIRINSVQYTIARLLGPGVGAVILRLGGVGTAFLANAISFSFVIVVLLVVRPRPNDVVARHRRVLETFREGALYVWRRPPLRLAVGLALASSMFGQSLQYIASAIADRVYAAGSEGNAGLLVTFGLGAMVSSATLLGFGQRWRRSRQVVGALTLLVVATASFPVSDMYVVGQFAYFLAGVAQVQIAVALNTLLQGSVPDEYRGRVMSLYLLGILGGIPAGSQLLGVLGDVIGFRAALAIDALALVVLLAWLLGTGRWQLLDSSPPDRSPRGIVSARRRR